MDVCKRMTGLTEEQFNHLFHSLQSVNVHIKNQRTAASALFMYLMKMRTALPYEDIAHAFHVTASTVSNLISKIRQVLQRDLVPHNVNYIRTREDLLEHNTIMSNALLDPEDQKKVMLICDGPYIFIDKSRNYTHQKKTYSGQKKTKFSQSNDGNCL